MRFVFFFLLFKECVSCSMFCLLYHLNSLRGLDVPRPLGYLYTQGDSMHRLFLSLRTQMKSNYFFSVSSLLWHITKLLQKAFMLLSSIFSSPVCFLISSLCFSSIPFCLSHLPRCRTLTRTHLKVGECVPQACLRLKCRNQF